MASALGIGSSKDKQSTGPKTPEGKAESKKNAKTHELLSSYACLSIESRAECDLIERGSIEEYRPATPTMCKLVKDLALFHWRGDRCVFFETALLNRSLASTSEDATLGELQDIMNDRAARAFADMSQDEALALLSRYETRFHRMYHRTLKTILDLQDRAAEQTLQNEPAVPESPLTTDDSVTTPDSRLTTEYSRLVLPNELPVAGVTHASGRRYGGPEPAPLRCFAA